MGMVSRTRSSWSGSQLQWWPPAMDGPWSVMFFYEKLVRNSGVALRLLTVGLGNPVDGVHGTPT